jgi:hypothetical protein
LTVRRTFFGNSHVVERLGALDLSRERRGFVRHSLTISCPRLEIPDLLRSAPGEGSDQPPPKVRDPDRPNDRGRRDSHGRAHNPSSARLFSNVKTARYKGDGSIMSTSADRYSTSQSTIPPHQPRARNDERSSRLERPFIVTPDGRATNSAMKMSDPSGRVVDVDRAFRTTRAQACRSARGSSAGNGAASFGAVRGRGRDLIKEGRDDEGIKNRRSGRPRDGRQPRYRASTDGSAPDSGRGEGLRHGARPGGAAGPERPAARCATARRDRP